MKQIMILLESFYVLIRKSVDAEYALGGLSNNIFASKYTYYIPNKDELIAQVESVLDEMDKE